MNDNGSLQIDIARDGGHVVVAVEGELDPMTAPELLEAVEPLQLDPAVETLVLDLSGVGFMDSSGLRVVINCHQELEGRGARLVLRSPSDAVHRLLEITDLVNRLNLEGA